MVLKSIRFFNYWGLPLASERGYPLPWASAKGRGYPLPWASAKGIIY